MWNTDLASIQKNIKDRLTRGLLDWVGPVLYQTFESFFNRGIYITSMNRHIKIRISNVFVSRTN